VNDYRLDVVASDVAAVIQALGHERCVLVAHDWWVSEVGSSDGVTNTSAGATGAWLLAWRHVPAVMHVAVVVGPQILRKDGASHLHAYSNKRTSNSQERTKGHRNQDCDSYAAWNLGHREVLRDTSQQGVCSTLAGTPACLLVRS
jgi:hypothetical protein